MRRARRALAALLPLVLLAAGCGGSGGITTLRVLAASSLSEVLDELGTRYGQLNPGTRIVASYAGSQEQALLVKEPQRRGDVLITADTVTMNSVANYVKSIRIVAHNALAIAVAPGNPRRVTGLQSLADPRLRVVLAAPNNPAGRYADQALRRAGVTLRPASREIDVRTVLIRVRTGEADAGIVYVTDLRSAGVAASGVPIPPGDNVTATYPAAVISRGEHGGAARAFVAWLTSPEARQIFRTYGFGQP